MTIRKIISFTSPIALALSLMMSTAAFAGTADVKLKTLDSEISKEITTISKEVTILDNKTLPYIQIDQNLGK